MMTNHSPVYTSPEFAFNSTQSQRLVHKPNRPARFILDPMEALMHGFKFLPAILSILFIACSGGGDSGGAKQASLNFTLLSTASTTSSPSAIFRQPGISYPGIAHGQVSASNLDSLKYYITDISICKDMTISGTGYSGQSGCISVYSAVRRYDYDTFNADDAALETELFLDLMSAQDRAKLTQTVYLTSQHLGEYHYGKVDHYRPVKLTGSIQLDDDTMVYTKAGTSMLVSGSGIDATYVTEVSDITTGPAEEAIVVLNNGGSWFKFEEPFTLTAEDIQNETAFQMKLAFNPEGAIKAYNHTSSNQVIQDSVNDYGIEVPLMPFTPVVFRSTETASKESYLFSYTSGAGSIYNAFDFRLELYTVQEDINDSIYAADTMQLLLRPDEDGGTDVTQVYRPFYVTSSNDATPVYTFINWLNNDFITGFSRGTHVGDTGTATFHVDTDNAITMDVLLRSIETIEADSTIETISAADLSGRWTGTCTTVDSGSRQDTYDFDGGNLLQTSIFYSDAACATEAEHLVKDFSIRLIDKATSTGGHEVKQIDFSYNSVTLTPKTTDRVDTRNADVYCDYDDWELDEGKDLLGQDNCLDLDAGDTIYDIYRVSATSLYRGDTPGATSEARPTTLSDSATASYTGEIPES